MVGHKTVRCPGQVYRVCGEKDPWTDICATVVTIFVCKADAGVSDDDKILCGEQKAFICDVSNKYFDESI